MSNRWRLILGILLLVYGLGQMCYMLVRYNDPPPAPRNAQARAFETGERIGGILGTIFGLGAGGFLIYSLYQSSESAGGRGAESEREPRRGQSRSQGNRKPWRGGRSDEDGDN